MNKVRIIFAAITICFAFSLIANAQPNSNSNSNQDLKKEAKPLNDRPLKIKSVLRPDVVGYCSGKGTVLVRITFHSSGKVTAVDRTKSSQCKYFNEEVEKISRKIKFEPAIKDGVAVTISKTLQFNYGIF